MIAKQRSTENARTNPGDKQKPCYLLQFSPEVGVLNKIGWTAKKTGFLM